MPEKFVGQCRTGKTLEGARQSGMTRNLMRVPSLSRRLAIVLSCPVLIALVGYGDYLEGDENSMLLLYLVPIALATWYNGLSAGIAMAILSLAADLISDSVGSVPKPGWWGVASNCLYFLIFAVLLSRCHTLLQNMRRRVEARTADLEREIATRKSLERKIAEAGDHERRRLARDLHDSLCQHLAGTALTAQIVASGLEEENHVSRQQAGKVVSLVDEGIEIARNIARGVFSEDLEGQGLACALEVLAKNASRQHGIECRFDQDIDPTMPLEKATQLYWIAREAVANAVIHAHATSVIIRLSNLGQHVELSVEDNGPGIPSIAADSNGIGLQVMAQRAGLAGGHLSIDRAPNGGAAIRCYISAHA